MATIQSAGRRETTVSPITEGPDIVVLARNVQKSFNGIQVLKGIDLEVHRGKVVAILGPSGSGKSTFLRCINHLEKMEAGSIQVDGVQIGYVEKDGKLEEAPLLGNRQAAQPHRHGLSELQSLSPYDGA